MKEHVISIGFPIPGGIANCMSFRSGSSLLDADVVVFAPNLEEYSVYDSYKGKPWLTGNDSARLSEDAEHWNRELEIALGDGKTVFLLMLEATDVYIETGQKQYSGTGRNARVTNLLAPFDPYSAVPVTSLTTVIHRSQGDRIKPTKNIGVLASYWREFGGCTYFDIYLEEAIGTSALVTQTGDKMVGGIIRFDNLKGVVVLLPPPNLNYLTKIRSKEFREALKSKKGASTATLAQNAEISKKASRAVGYQFLSAMIEIDKAIRASSERTPTPNWAQGAEYVLREEQSLNDALKQLEHQVVELRSNMDQIESKLDTAGNLRGLLFETGRALESAVLEALRLMDFKADRFVDEESEFDIVFEGASGTRLIGEVEGKNDKAINIDKLSQLERNIQEDFKKREDATGYAKGVLFDNAFRLTPPGERGDYFTHKCVTGAKRSGIALVRTPDLFNVAKYLKENQDPNFAAVCRDAIINTAGEIVRFPQRSSVAS